MKLLRQIPSIGPIQATLLVAWLQTPQRFRSKRQLWAYSGFAVETHDSACRSFELDGIATISKETPTRMDNQPNFSTVAKLQWAGSREKISPSGRGGAFFLDIPFYRAH